MVTGDSPAHNTLTGEIIYLEVTIGSFVCKSATPTCLIGSDMPPVEIQVHTIWTVNDFTGKDPLERPLGVFTASVRIFTWKDPIKAIKAVN